MLNYISHILRFTLTNIKCNNNNSNNKGDVFTSSFPCSIAEGKPAEKKKSEMNREDPFVVFAMVIIHHLDKSVVC